MGINSVDFDSIKNMFYRNPDSDFKDSRIDRGLPRMMKIKKKAYRKMAITYHPDKVADMGEQYQKGAKEKFQQVQDAYENLKKLREIK